MQANCPKCSNRIVVDDAKVPDRPFNVKCPKCQAIVRFPGKGAAAPAAAPPAAAPAPPAPAPTPAPAPAPAPPPAAAQESFDPPPLPPASAREEGEAGHALVVLPDGNLTGAVTVALTRAGYTVQSPDTPAEGVAMLEQGFDVVVTARTGVGEGDDDLYQRIGRMGSEGRRGIFLVLIGDEFRTGDGTQAWCVLADLVMKPADVASADRFVRGVVAERKRVYKAFDEGWRRVEEQKRR